MSAVALAAYGMRPAAVNVLIPVPPYAPLKTVVSAKAFAVNVVPSKTRPADVANAVADAAYGMRFAAVNVATPVPPKATPSEAPILVIVHSRVMLSCVALGSVELILGTPVPEVMSTPSLPVARPATVLVAEE